MRSNPLSQTIRCESARTCTFLTVVVLGLASLAGCSATPSFNPEDPYDSGGPLLAEQAAYDVLSYDLTVEVFPDSKMIRGAVVVTARIGSPLSWFVLDLDPVLEVDSVSSLDLDGSKREVDFERRGPKLWIALQPMRQPGDEVQVEVAYGGTPRDAPMPPWQGGFTWSRTSDGKPWIATTCQGEGADIWWPVKDHVSDEPNQMTIRVTVPDPLVVASNGRLQKVEALGDGRTTYHWHVSNPINAYNVALNIAPYETIEDSFTSVTGEEFPVIFYVLPENLEDGRKLLPEIFEHLRFYEELLGPYPFRADKYGVAQTPHLGMEHQTIIAYGAGFRRDAMTRNVDWGFDALHHHELSHEWWGNLVTNADWSDMWIHEGFGTYMQALYLERSQGSEKYHEYLKSVRRRMSNRAPLAPRRALSSRQVMGGEIYFKGAWVLHTLRYLIGDDVFLKTLRRMAYPDPSLEKVTDGRQCRFVTTDDFLELAESQSGRKLGWFFEVYLRRPELPRLNATIRRGELLLQWQTADGIDFPMPIDVQLGDGVQRIEMFDGRASIKIPPNVKPVIDPDGWVLRDE